MADARVLVLGGTSYVAQYICEQYLREPSAHSGALVACSIRAVRDACPLPSGYAYATDQLPTQGGKHKAVVWVYPGVRLDDMPGVADCINHFSPTVVINCVAMASPAACQHDPEQARALNEPRDLIKYLRESEHVRYLHFSTDFVYDGSLPPESGYPEEAAEPSAGQCVYSATKLAFDQYLLEQRDFDAWILRIANVVGARSPIFTHQSPKFIEWLHKELYCSPDTAQLSGVRLWSDEVRSFVYAEDLARLVWEIVSVRTVKPTAQVFNVGGEEALSRVTLAERFIKAYTHEYPTARPRPIEPSARAAVDLGYRSPLNAALDSTKIKSLFKQFRFSSTDELLHDICIKFGEREGS